jgi:hypothetical protein
MSVEIKLTNASGTISSAIFRELEPGTDLMQWKQKWLPVLKEQETEDAHWDWPGKYVERTGDNFEHYAIECDAEVQGLMIIEIDFHRSRAKKLELVYVDFVAVAPWNRRDLVEKPAYTYVGSHLIRAAVARSKALGYKHRIGLHSLVSAETFYRHIGMGEFGKDSGYCNLVYFEFEDQAGKHYLDKGKV